MNENAPSVAFWIAVAIVGSIVAVCVYKYRVKKLEYEQKPAIQQVEE